MNTRVRRGIALTCTVLLSSGATFAAPLVLKGKWVLDAQGRGVGPDSFRRGLQSSGLMFRGGELWSVGDQRSQYPGHVFRIDPDTGRLIGSPLELRLPAPRDGENRHFGTYRGIPNSDFEGLTAHPRDARRLFAVTEDKVPWIAEIEVSEHKPSSPPRLSIRSLTEIRFPAGLEPWRGDSNFRSEGIAISDDARTAWIAFERASDELPRILELPLESVGKAPSLTPEELSVPFAALPRRSDKAQARLNLNDLQFLRWKRKAYLLAVARDQERLLVIDLESREVKRRVDLELRDPAGRRIYWVSPEGLAFDAARDKLWIINDPDSVRGNYRARASEAASGRFAEYAPLLFETELSAIMRADPVTDGENGDGGERKE